MRFLISISGHGLGHLSQASQVVNALHRFSSEVTFVIRSPLTKQVIKSWVLPEFEHILCEDDIGMCMTSALDVDISASLKAYHDFHEHWTEKVDTLAKQMLKQKVDLVLSDVAYLPLAAAQRVAIPNVVLCSLNWADIVAKYFSTSQQAKLWIEIARHAYQSANLFIQPQPSMEMSWLNNCYEVDPIGRIGRRQQKQLLRQLGVKEGTYLVLVGMGGMDFALSPIQWPKQIDDRAIHYLLPAGMSVDCANTTCVNQLQSCYVDILASMDLIITKPGYGMFVEAAAAGIPLLYVARSDWPDVGSLKCWIHSVAYAEEISRSTLEGDHISAAMTCLLEQGGYTPIVPEGDRQAADILLSMIPK